MTFMWIWLLILSALQLLLITSKNKDNKDVLYSFIAVIAFMPPMVWAIIQLYPWK